MLEPTVRVRQNLDDSIVFSTASDCIGIYAVDQWEKLQDVMLADPFALTALTWGLGEMARLCAFVRYIFLTHECDVPLEGFDSDFLKHFGDA